MPESDDITRLKQYVEGDESAFAVLVERYVHLVYSTALRQAGNPSQVEEITQAVFIILAQKAKSLGPRTILSGWLYQTARLAAANFLRSEIRRQKREQEAYMESLLTEPTPNLWQQIAPLRERGNKAGLMNAAVFVGGEQHARVTRMQRKRKHLAANGGNGSGTGVSPVSFRLFRRT